MEGIVLDVVVAESGVFLSGIVLLLLAFGAILMGYLADQQKAGKRFFWTGVSIPEPELRRLPSEGRRGPSGGLRS